MWHRQAREAETVTLESLKRRGNTHCSESGIDTPAIDASLFFSRLMNLQNAVTSQWRADRGNLPRLFSRLRGTHRGDPTLSKTPDGNAVIPATDKSMPPPIALSQAPSRISGAPEQEGGFSVVVGNYLTILFTSIT